MGKEYLNKQKKDWNISATWHYRAPFFQHFFLRFSILYIYSTNFISYHDFERKTGQIRDGLAIVNKTKLINEINFLNNCQTIYIKIVFFLRILILHQFIRFGTVISWHHFQNSFIFETRSSSRHRKLCVPSTELVQ